MYFLESPCIILSSSLRQFNIQQSTSLQEQNSISGRSQRNQFFSWGFRTRPLTPVGQGSLKTAFKPFAYIKKKKKISKCIGCHAQSPVNRVEVELWHSSKSKFAYACYHPPTPPSKGNVNTPANRLFPLTLFFPEVILQISPSSFNTQEGSGKWLLWKTLR